MFQVGQDVALASSVCMLTGGDRMLKKSLMMWLLFLQSQLEGGPLVGGHLDRLLRDVPR